MLLAAMSAAARAELKVDVYEGPTVCNEADTVKVGDRVAIHYVGSIAATSATGTPGAQFDSSRTRDAVLEATVGFGDLIAGWDQGLIGLCAGAKATLVIPPDLAYGDRGAGGGAIPGGATLAFDVEVVAVRGPAPVPDLFAALDVDGDGLLTTDEIRAHFRKSGDAESLPPHLMENEDTDRDGVISREEFGGPRMPWDMCLELLHTNSEAVTTDALSVQWVCQRPRDPDGGRDGGEGRDEL